MDEFNFISHIRPTFYKQNSVIKGIGDDAAVFRTFEDVVIATDTFVEYVHFSEQTTTPYHIGWRALAANISDIAAMGAIPKFYLVSITIPNSKHEEFLLEVYQGMRDLASIYEMDLIGGDTVSGNELSLSITILGFVNKEKARYRATAKDGDVVFVSGTLGDSRAGLEILMNGMSEVKDKSYFVKRHQMPLPQVELAKLLQRVDRVSLNDISDGIANELHEIAEASSVTIIIDDSLIPVHPSFKEFSPNQQFNWKYFGGEDFELVGTISESDYENLELNAAKQEIKLTRIGNVITSHPKESVFLKRNGKIVPLFKKGYIHLKQVKK